MEGKHPTLEEAEKGGYFHPDGAQYLHVDLVQGSCKVSKSDSENAEKDMANHEIWGEGEGTEEIDREALETGYGFLQLVVPITAPGVNRRAAAAIFAAIFMVDDSMNMTMDYDPESRAICGKSLRTHAEDLVKDIGNEGYTKYISGALELNHLRQFEQTKARRDIANFKLPTQLDEWLRWRECEGQFYTLLLVFLTVGGVDVRDVPSKAVEDALIGAIFNFDIHSHYRHSSEKEVGDVLLHLKGSFHNRVSQALKVVRTSYDNIVDLEMSDQAKGILTRYILVAGESNYLTERYWKSSAVHASKKCKDNTHWKHTHLAGKGEAFHKGLSGLKYHQK